MEYIAKPFGFIMKFCYNLLSNYGVAIILFTLITKFILFPIALWTHKNSLNLIKIKPHQKTSRASPPGGFELIYILYFINIKSFVFVYYL